MDANANRAREGVRVLEDYARFVLDDPDITAKLKRLRHALTALLKPIQRELTGARNAAGDVGCGAVVKSEYVRATDDALVIANAARLQEALRSLEEFSKLSSSARAGKFERLRFKAYVLGQLLEVSAVRRSKLENLGVYAVLTGKLIRGNPEERVKKLLKAGIDAVQLREKNMDDGPYIRLARKLCKIVQSAGKLFFVNDRVHVCEIVNADGLHLGQSDASVRDARAVVSAARIIGLSTHSLAQAQKAFRARPDYISVGPIFPTPLKSFRPAVGTKLLKRVAALSPAPIVAIGAIDAKNAPDVFASGASAVALSRPMCAGGNVEQLVKSLKRAHFSSVVRRKKNRAGER